jgi:hypothetical protein
MKRVKWIAGALLGLVLTSTAARADFQLWVDDAAGTIGKVDVDTGAVTLVGNSGAPLTDIAFDPNGNLYGVSFTDLYKIDASTGAATDLGAITGAPGAGFNALVFGTDGTLYSAGFSSQELYSINPTTLAATDLGNLGVESGGDLAFVGGNLYLSSSTSHLILVNNPSGPATGTDLGPIGFPNVFGLASPDNATLYGVAGTQILLINPANGAATPVSDWSGNPEGFGQAFGESFITEAQPPSVPEPSSFALVVFGCLTLLGPGRRLLRRPSPDDDR